MNKLDIFTKIYGRLQNYGMPFWVMTPIRRLVRGWANKVLPKYLSQPNSHKARVENNLIVSLTSFPARINNVWQVIECLKRQTVLPEKIILWLSKEQFPNEKCIPDSIRKEEDCLFEIRLVKGDIRSHKKYFYVLQEYPEKTFITCDDDVYYDSSLIEHLLNASMRYPGCVIANYTAQIQYTKEGLLCDYRQWRSDIKEYESKDLIQIGVGGVLYPPHCLNSLVSNNKVFQAVAPLADDIWLNAMARLNHTPVVKAPGNRLVLPIVDVSPTLTSVNNGAESMNDVQIRQIREYFRKNSLEDIYSSTYTVEVNVQ